ncbi:uncharacterized protein [Hemitrygon akajei]|uniref:uncharacterized protein n=1 Tax=Hemitrygon akajei TaxID=2704970 RepID=UPI003BF9F097
MLQYIRDIRCSPPNFISGPIMISMEKKASLINIDDRQMILCIHDIRLNHNSIELPQLQELIDNLFPEELFFKQQASNCNGRCSPPNITRGVPNRLFILLENKACLRNIDSIQMMLHIYDLRYELEFVQLEHDWQDPQVLVHMTHLVKTDEGFHLCDGDGRILIDRVISAAQLKYNSIPKVVYRLVPSVDTAQQNNSLSIWQAIQENRI